MLCTATPNISSSCENINSTARVSRLPSRFLWLCYKQCYSLNVQGVCDCKDYFMDVDCRWPGSCHDDKFYANSSINRKMQHKEIPIIYKQIIPGEAKIANYLTGDPAYPLHFVWKNKNLVNLMHKQFLIVCWEKHKTLMNVPKDVSKLDGVFWIRKLTSSLKVFSQ